MIVSHSRGTMRVPGRSVTCPRRGRLLMRGTDVAKPTCSVDGCEQIAVGRGWCNRHYLRWRKHGDPGPADDSRYAPPSPCTIDGCDEPARGRGWCAMHYLRWLRRGDPLSTAHTLRHVATSGYVVVREPTHPLALASGYVYEHRKVVFDAGIPIPPGAHVHHKNHDRTDNRLENLEVLSMVEHMRLHKEAKVG